MRFALLIYQDEKAWEGTPDAGKVQTYREHEEYGAWLEKQGWDRGGEELHATDKAKTVRVHGTGHIVTDGPFAETKEQLGGFYVIECDDIAQAIEAAKRMPARLVEVRPIVTEQERPS